MNRSPLILTICLLLAGTAQAEEYREKRPPPPPSHQGQSSASLIEALTKVDTTRFCIYENKIYSKGAKVNDKQITLQCSVPHGFDKDLVWR